MRRKLDEYARISANSPLLDSIGLLAGGYRTRENKSNAWNAMFSLEAPFSGKLSWKICAIRCIGLILNQTCLNMILKEILFCIADEQRATDCSLLSDRELVEYA